MAKKSVSEKRIERERKENQALGRVFDLFLLGLAAEVFLYIAYRGFVAGSIRSMLAWYYGLLGCAAFGLVLAAAGLVLLFVARKKPGKTGKLLGRLAPWCLAVGLFLAVAGWVVTRSYEGYGITIMSILVPIATVLGIIYLLYQHECFLCTAALGGTLFAVWARSATAASAAWRAPVIGGVVFGAVLLAAAAALVYRAQKNGGKVKGMRICSPSCDYRVVYAALAAGFVCVLAALAAPALAYYLMWAAGILLFVELAYYTTQLM